MSPEQVVQKAREIHSLYWQATGDGSKGTRLASCVCSNWQRAVIEAGGNQFVKEFKIAPDLNEKFDLVDLINGVVYELKASPGNTHFEFYKNIFKALLVRDDRLPQIHKFIFITPTAGADRMNKGLGKATMDYVCKLGLQVEIHNI